MGTYSSVINVKQSEFARQRSLQLYMELTVAVRKEKILNKNTVYQSFYLPSFIAINYFQGPK